MIAKSCPKCAMQVAVASKSCKCGHTFFASRRAADHLPAVDVTRRTGRVRRAQPQFYDAQHYQKQNRRKNKKRSLSRSMDEDYNKKDANKSESATIRARRRRALRRAQREANPPPARRDPAPQLGPAQLARCSLILDEINRKMGAVTWQPPM